MAADFSEAAIYVGTYAKYNAGSLFGKWFNLSDFADKDEFMEACKELHKDEEDPEFMFQDRENIPEELVSESWISEIFFELRDKVEDMDSTVQEAFSAWLDYENRDLSKADNRLEQSQFILRMMIDTPARQSDSFLQFYHRHLLVIVL